MKAKIDFDGEVVAGRNYRFTVVATYGLAARPTAMIVKTLQQMTGDIVMGNVCEEKNARSIMEVLTLEMYPGREGYLRFSESQPAAPLRALSDLIRITEMTHEA